MQIGLLGKANVGKSTFFSAATETAVPTGNFPFTTIKPNIGVAHVRTKCACRHFDVQHQNPSCTDGVRHVPVKLIDVAGLVPGAHEGKGLGNQFLDDARQAEVLIHVVDIAGTTDMQGQSVPAGSHDPLEDVRFVQDEFDRWFLDVLGRDWDKIAREVEQQRSGIADAIARRFTGLGIRDYEVQAALQQTNLASKNPKEWSTDDQLAFARQLRTNTKPFIIAANKADLCHNLDVMRDIPGTAVPCSSEAELLLRRAAKSGVVDYAPGDEKFSICNEAGLAEQQKKALALVGSVFSRIHSTGVQQILEAAVFDTLKCLVVYPVEDETRLTNKDGDVLPDAKLVPAGSTARDLAGLIHADIAKGFLHAIDCKTRQRVGADHRLQDGDVIKIVSTLSRG